MSPKGVKPTIEETLALLAARVRHLESLEPAVIGIEIISPTADKFTPIQTRMDEASMVWFDGTYFACDCKAAGHWTSWITAQRLFDYGTYEWKGKFEGIGANCELYFGFEYHHGTLADGIIAFANIGGTYRAYTAWGGNSEFTNLPGEDWTAEKTFKVVWDASDVYFYVDDVEKAHHNTWIPQTAMMLFGEAGNRTGARSHFRESSFVEL